VIVIGICPRLARAAASFSCNGNERGRKLAWIKAHPKADHLHPLAFYRTSLPGGVKMRAICDQAFDPTLPCSRQSQRSSKQLHLPHLNLRPLADLAGRNSCGPKKTVRGQ
jgi:hypothetical protein